MQPEHITNLTTASKDAIRIASRETMPLLRAQGNLETVSLLAALLKDRSAAKVFPDTPSPEACLAGLWLRAGGWKQAHEISQALQTREGFYWHALVHRQEPDAFNAKYWLRRVGEHPIFACLSEHARAHFALLDLPGGWSPGRFVDICVCPSTPEIAQAAAALQEIEWRLLFEFCARSAAI